MNTYKITFQRESGSTGSDLFTAATEAQARRDFNEVYRHGNGKITSVELISENAPATKEQERKALEKIKTIIDQLGPDSYLATAFDGCLQDAEDNITDDAAYSMKDRWESEKRTSDSLREIIDDLRAKLDESEKYTEQKEAEVEALRAQVLTIGDLETISGLLVDKNLELGKETAAAAERIVEAAEQPETAAFQNAVKDHRAAKAELHKLTGLLARVNTVKAARAGA